MKNLKTLIKKSRLKSLAWAFMVLPLNQPPSWNQIQFSNIKQNQVHYTKEGLLIKVNSSASPLVYVLPHERSVDSIRVKAKLSGAPPTIPHQAKQGSKEFDDFVLRVGLIVKGNRRLNWFQRQLAPEWLLTLEKLLPQGLGLDHVRFITTCQQKELVNKIRKHYLHTSLVEECVTPIKETGPFTLHKELKKPLDVLGVWVGSDGDQTDSQFEVLIEEIQLSYK